MRAILLFALMARFCAAQTIEVDSLFQPAPLAGLWKHHPGDDPRWGGPCLRRLGLAERAYAGSSGSAIAWIFLVPVPGAAAGEYAQGKAGPDDRRLR